MRKKPLNNTMVISIGDFRLLHEEYAASYSDLEDLATHIVKEYGLTGKDASDIWELLTSDLSDDIDRKASRICEITGADMGEILKHFDFYKFVLTEGRVSIPSILYHAADGSKTTSILEHGLTVKRGEKRWKDNDYPDGVYAFDDVGDAKRYAVLHCNDGEVWRIDARGLRFRVDPEPTDDSYFEGASSFYTMQDVPVDRLTMIELGEDEREEIWREFE